MRLDYALVRTLQNDAGATTHSARFKLDAQGVATRLDANPSHGVSRRPSAHGAAAARWRI